MDAFILHVDTCLTPLELIRDACILCRHGQIIAVGGFSAFVGLDDLPRLERPGCVAVPGLIDTHLHGTGGCDLMQADVDDDIGCMSAVLAVHGVTSFVPVILSASRHKMLNLAQVLAGLCHDDHAGAVPVALHLEGPYLNRQRVGTQPLEHVRSIDLGEMRALLQAAAGTIRVVTFAPELAQAAELIALLRENHVVPSMGHTAADEYAAKRAIDAGATRCTHFYNGMPPLAQRDIGITAVALTDERVTIELIADGVHVHPRMIDLACRTKPRDRVVGTSDATQGAGMADGLYQLGDDQIEVQHGESRRVADARLAGSGITLERAMHKFMGFAPSLTTRDAIACYTLNAARSIGLTDRGTIQPGKRADIAVFDKDWNVAMTVIKGRIVFDRNAGPAITDTPPPPLPAAEAEPRAENHSPA